MTALAFDIGGANLKVSAGESYSFSRPFALWKYPERLVEELSALIDGSPESDTVVATMTGELADCYANKKEGVHSIVDALRQSINGRGLSIYLTNGDFVTAEVAKEHYQLAAAANWHALANYASKITGCDHALLVDVGSTTCDIIPIVEGEVAARGATDTQRLLENELLYVGVERTPICAIVNRVPYRDQECPVARELFATTRDVHLVTGDMPEQPNDRDTADGRPATRENALVRLARCICADIDEFDDEDGSSLASYVSWELRELIQDAVEAVSCRHDFDESTPIVLAGQGEFVVNGFLDRSQRRISLAETIGPDAARCAPAFALAKLAESEC